MAQQTTRELRPFVSVKSFTDFTPDLSVSNIIGLIGFVDDVSTLAADVEVGEPIVLGQVTTVERAVTVCQSLGLRFRFATSTTLDLDNTDPVAAQLLHMAIFFQNYSPIGADQDLNNVGVVLCILDPLVNSRTVSPFGNFFISARERSVVMDVIVPPYEFLEGDIGVTGNYYDEVVNYATSRYSDSQPIYGANHVLLANTSYRKSEITPPNSPNSPFVTVLMHPQSAIELWTELTSRGMPSGTGSTSVEYNGKVYIFGGGETASSEINDLWEYDIVNGTWLQLTSGATARRNMTSVEYNGKMYIFGGDDGTTRLNDLWEYDIANDTWLQLTSGATPREYAVSVEYSGKMYVFGGSNGATRFNDLWEYDIANDTWLQLTSGATGRNGMTSIEYNGKMYIFGGSDFTTNLNDLWEYDIANDTWLQLTSGATPRFLATAVEYNGKMYVFAGLDSSFDPLDDLWEYDIVNDTWLQLTSRGSNPTANLDSAQYQGKMYTFELGTPLNAVWEYDIVAGEVTTYQMSAPTLASALSPVIGGMDRPYAGFFGQVVNTIPVPWDKAEVFNEDVVSTLNQWGFSVLETNVNTSVVSLSRLLVGLLQDPVTEVARSYMLDVQSWLANYDFKNSLYKRFVSSGIINSKFTVSATGSSAVLSRARDLMIAEAVRFALLEIFAIQPEDVADQFSALLNATNVNEIIAACPFFPASIIYQISASVSVQDFVPFLSEDLVTNA